MESGAIGPIGETNGSIKIKNMFGGEEKQKEGKYRREKWNENVKVIIVRK